MQQNHERPLQPYMMAHISPTLPTATHRRAGAIMAPAYWALQYFARTSESPKAPKGPQCPQCPMCVMAPLAGCTDRANTMNDWLCWRVGKPLVLVLGPIPIPLPMPLVHGEWAKN